ncbi:hypothetical protein CPB83DRAFT_864610 [Crepidotus variabilis]|uniref:F-box domain-containing protein n=1 Tax=Crepidotus variabilis TaxID=179855 RepID=A0A9P6E4F6_9AGAR|nr:hypothetical protein CPB83DRAFT_864610 [Crepidotus variabilis]
MPERKNAGALDPLLKERCDAFIELDVMTADSNITYEEGLRRIGTSESLNSLRDPLHHIPQEIVSRIFEIFYEEKGTPFILCAVCHLWREIALATPKIWRTVRLILTPAVEDSIFMELLKEYVERSGGLGIDICLTWSGNEVMDFSHPFLPAIVEIVRSCASRWNSLELELPLGTLRSLFHDLSVTSPTLRYLKLFPTAFYTDGGELDENEAERSLNLTSISGRLETFDLIPYSEDTDPIVLEEVEVNFSRLTRIAGPGTHVVLAKILRLSPHLKSAKIDIIPSRQTEENIFSLVGEPFTHQSLQHLEFTSMLAYAHPINHFLTEFTFPNLQSLIFEGLFVPECLQLDVMVAFFMKSGQVLGRLDLSRISWTVEELQQILAALPNLEELSFGHTAHMSATKILEAVFDGEMTELPVESKTHTTPSRLPKLCFLEISNGSWKAGDTWDNIRLIEKHIKRNNLVYTKSDSLRLPLLEIELSFNPEHTIPYLECQHLEMFLKLREMSVHLNISYLSRDSDTGEDLIRASVNELEDTCIDQLQRFCTYR